METVTIYVLEHECHGIVATGTSLEITRAWLTYDGGEFELRPQMMMVDDGAGNEIERQATAHTLKVWDVYIKENCRARFLKANRVALGENEQEAELDFLADCWNDGISKARNFSVMTKENYDKVQAELQTETAEQQDIGGTSAESVNREANR